MPVLEVKEGWLPAQTLLRLPSWIDIGLAYTAEPMLNPLGGSSQRAGWMQQTALSMSLSSGLSRPVSQWREPDHWSLNANVNHFSGDPSYGEQIGALFPLQQLAHNTGFWLSEASISRASGNGWISVKGGVVPLNPDFISAPIFDFYVHSAFNDTLNIAVDDLPINPISALGGIVSLQPSPAISLRYGWFDLSTSLPLSSWLGVRQTFRDRGGSAQLLQLDVTPEAGLPSTELKACRRGTGIQRRREACTAPVQVSRQLPTTRFSLGGIHTSNEGQGLYGSLTVPSGLQLGLDNRLWLGGSLWTDRTLNSAPSFVAGGLVVQGPLASRPLDVLVLGLGKAGLSRRADPGLPDGFEAMVELGYQVQINRNVALQPTLQWILQPSGTAAPLPSILAAGLQLSVSF